MKYAAFIRGINVGGKVLVKMVDLKKMFEKMGFKNVATVLASGNVVFDTMVPETHLEETIEAALQKIYKRDIAVFIRTVAELEKLDKLQPFKGIKVTPNTRLYVTFCESAPKDIKPKTHPGFKNLGAKGKEIFSVLELSPTIQTPDVMKILGPNLGQTTMRNWNTIQKILKAP